MVSCRCSWFDFENALSVAKLQRALCFTLPTLILSEGLPLSRTLNGFVMQQIHKRLKKNTYNTITFKQTSKKVYIDLRVSHFASPKYQ